MKKVPKNAKRPRREVLAEVKRQRLLTSGYLDGMRAARNLILDALGIEAVALNVRHAGVTYKVLGVRREE